MFEQYLKNDEETFIFTFIGNSFCFTLFQYINKQYIEEKMDQNFLMTFNKGTINMTYIIFI